MVVYRRELKETTSAKCTVQCSIGTSYYSQMFTLSRDLLHTIDLETVSLCFQRTRGLLKKTDSSQTKAIQYQQCYEESVRVGEWKREILALIGEEMFRNKL